MDVVGCDASALRLHEWGFFMTHYPEAPLTGLEMSLGEDRDVLWARATGCNKQNSNPSFGA